MLSYLRMSIPDLSDVCLQDAGALVASVNRMVSKNICVMPLRYRLHDFLSDGEPGEEWMVAGGVEVHLESGRSYKAGPDGLIFMDTKRPVASRKVHLFRPPDAVLDKFFDRDGKKGLSRFGQSTSDVLMPRLPKVVLGHSHRYVDD